VTSLLATLALGAVAVPLNPLYRARELAFHIRSNRMAGVVTVPASTAACAEAIAQSGHDTRLLSLGSTASGTNIAPQISAAPPIQPVEVRAEDTAIMLHTAGSSGRSKLVPRSHAQVRAECDSLAATALTEADDVIFGILPLYHCHGLFNCLLAALRAQCRLCLFMDARPLVLVRNEAMATLVRERVTIFPTIPFQLDQLLSAQGHFDLSALRLCFSGGAALKEQTFDGFAKRFGIPIRQQYGCTEAGAVTLNLGNDLAHTRLSAGQPLAGVTLSILDADPSGEGEICVSSPALTSGYEGLEDLNRALFVDGVFRTGDMGRVDEAGNLYVTRRRPIYIDVAGHKVDSSEVEDILREIPGIVDVAVVGTLTTPAAMKAVIVCSAPLSTQALREFCRQQLASYKIPSVFEFRDALPRDTMGKQLRRELM
jgi:long-chain acyl-CoA synthetase